MGGGASRGAANMIMVSAGIIVPIESDNQTLVESFTELAYLNGDKMDGLQLMLRNKNAQIAFTQFLSTETSAIDFFAEVENLLKEDQSKSIIGAKTIADLYQNGPNTTQTLPGTESIYSNICDFIDRKNEKSLFSVGATTVSDEVPQTLPLPQLLETEEDVDLSSSSSEPVDGIYNATNEAIVLLALSLFPKFIGSEAYNNWRKREKEESLSVKSFPDPVVEDADQCVSSAITDSFARSCKQNMDPASIDRIFASGSWLSTFVSAAEGLPMCISLADADVQRPHFPLIFVNQMFEKTTGHSRREIIGSNCKFLQGELTEQYSIFKLTKSLQTYTPTRVSITNYRKNGTTFLNLLALKPIFDLDGNCCYVVGVQFDYSVQGSRQMTMVQLVDKLISIIPDTIPRGGYL
uniref:Putative LOV domain-containing protein n=1 Tax=Mallomonas sp. BC-2016 TaxID=1802913 RepID=A0A126WV73_9STRA|nr:putative LOV domain-containing protein [Mallomonas sp. BC-2016]